jgi:hypothetical protein
MRVEVEVGDVREHDADVPIALEDRAKRIGDLAWRERPRRDLVGQRLEEMEVAAVDQRDLDRRTPQLPDRLDATETSAYYDDVVYPGRGGGHSVDYFSCFRSVGECNGSPRPEAFDCSRAANRGRLASGPV